MVLFIIFMMLPWGALTVAHAPSHGSGIGAAIARKLSQDLERPLAMLYY
jgi:hypothetical protein